MNLTVSRLAVATLASLALVGSAASANAQQLKRIELRAQVTDSQLGEIPVGETIRVHATPGDVERFRIPAVLKLTVNPPGITLEPVVQAQFFVNGPVTRSRISGIRDGDRLECTIDMIRLTMSLPGFATSSSRMIRRISATWRIPKTKVTMRAASVAPPGPAGTCARSVVRTVETGSVVRTTRGSVVDVSCTVVRS